MGVGPHASYVIAASTVLGGGAAGAGGEADDDEDEEAEYAWLPPDSLKPFKLGDLTGNDDGQASEDVVLAESVSAAERSLRAAGARQPPSGKGYIQDDLYGGYSDSDGGWGIAVQVSKEQHSSRLVCNGRHICMPQHISVGCLQSCQVCWQLRQTLADRVFRGLLLGQFGDAVGGMLTTSVCT